MSLSPPVAPPTAVSPLRAVGPSLSNIAHENAAGGENGKLFRDTLAAQQRTEDTEAAAKKATQMRSMSSDHARDESANATRSREQRTLTQGAQANQAYAQARMDQARADARQQASRSAQQAHAATWDTQAARMADDDSALAMVRRGAKDSGANDDGREDDTQGARPDSRNPSIEAAAQSSVTALPAQSDKSGALDNNGANDVPSVQGNRDNAAGRPVSVPVTNATSGTSDADDRAAIARDAGPGHKNSLDDADVDVDVDADVGAGGPRGPSAPASTQNANAEQTVSSDASAVATSATAAGISSGATFNATANATFNAAANATSDTSPSSMLTDARARTVGQASATEPMEASMRRFAMGNERNDVSTDTDVQPGTRRSGTVGDTDKSAPIGVNDPASSGHSPALSNQLDPALLSTSGGMAHHGANGDASFASATASTATNPASNTASASASGASNIDITAPFGDPRWAAAFSQRIFMMSNGDTSRAELHLNPRQLGPIQVTLNLSGNQAQASFITDHPHVRAAIEAALPGLRERFAENGLTLTQTQVDARTTPADRQADAGFGTSLANGSGGGWTGGSGQSGNRARHDEANETAVIRGGGAARPAPAIDSIWRGVNGIDKHDGVDMARFGAGRRSIDTFA